MFLHSKIQNGLKLNTKIAIIKGEEIDLLYKKLKQKRLVKKAVFYDSYDEDDAKYGFVSIFENPNSEDIAEAKDEGGSDVIRGIIMNDGTIYCWTGIALHSHIPSSMKIDMDNGFRFAYEKGEWIFDLNKNMTFEEGLRKYVENSSKLSNFGSLEGVMAFFFGSDNEKDYEKYDRNWSYLSDIRNQMLGFDNGGAVQMFVRNIDIINK